MSGLAVLDVSGLAVLDVSGMSGMSGMSGLAMSFFYGISDMSRIPALRDFSVSGLGSLPREPNPAALIMSLIMCQ